jgi:pyridoxal phosphate enzyme (YggS family)
MPETAFRDRLARVADVIEARRGAGGWHHQVRIIAVTKTHGIEAVRMAVEAGLDDVGENRVQEAMAKQDAAAGIAVAWHLIGGLQRNKARHAAGRFALIHSIDRIDVAEELDRRVSGESRQPVLVQVNCSSEPQKGGVAPDQLPGLLDALRRCVRLEVRGLMTMAAFGAPESQVRASFALLRRLAETGRGAGHPLTELSMGMSDDFAVAVEEGATMVRLGAALFGPRPIA